MVHVPIVSELQRLLAAVENKTVCCAYTDLCVHLCVCKFVRTRACFCAARVIAANPMFKIYSYIILLDVFRRI
jgi:hypothetical protein